MPAGQLVLSRKAGGRIARVHRAVAVAELRPLARGAAVGVRLADDDRLVLQLREAGDQLERRIDVAELIGHSHPHVAFYETGRALGMKRQKVERRADLARDVVRAAEAVLEKLAHEGASGPAGRGR